MFHATRGLCLAALVVVLALGTLACQSAPRGSEGAGPASAPPASGPAPASQAPAPAAPANTAPPAPVKARISQPLDALSLASVYVARANGYFADEGLEPEIVTFSGGGPDVQALIAGDVDFDVTAATFLISAYQEGNPLLGVVSILNRAVVNGIMHKDVAQAKGITPTTPLRDKLAALRGLTIGVSRPGSLTFQMGTYFIQQAGLTPGSDASVLAVGGGSAMLAALEQRKVDVIMNSPPEPEEAIRQGFGVMFINNSAGEDPALADFLQQVVLVRPDYARDNPDMVRRMVRVMVRANRWINEHSAEEFAAVLQPFFSQMPSETLVDSARAVQPAVPADGRMTEQGILVNYKLMELTGSLKSRPPWDALVTNEYLPQ